jgi:hypothetical protein
MKEYENWVFWIEWMKFGFVWMFMLEIEFGMVWVKDWSGLVEF